MQDAGDMAGLLLVRFQRFLVGVLCRLIRITLGKILLATDVVLVERFE